jgi:hypothetical protein
MITLPSSPSSESAPDSARQRVSSLGSMSPTENAPRIRISKPVTSPIDSPVSQSATAAPAVDLGTEADPDEHSLTSELSDLSDDPDFQRRVEERGQKRIILRNLATRDEEGEELNEEDQALLSELRRAQEIETAAWSSGARGLFEVEKIETTHWERYKERLRAEAVADETDPFGRDCQGDEYGECGEEGIDIEGTGSGSDAGRRPLYGVFIFFLPSRLRGPEILTKRDHLYRS